MINIPLLLFDVPYFIVMSAPLCIHEKQSQTICNNNTVGNLNGRMGLVLFCFPESSFFDSLWNIKIFTRV